MQDRLKNTGAFCCSCGATIETEAIVDFMRRHPDAAEVGEHPCLCAAEGLQYLAKQIRETGLDRVMIASCLSGHRESLWRAVLKDEGLDPDLLTVAPVREWDDGSARLDAVAMALGHLQQREPRTPSPVAVTQRALVVGAGTGGMRTALNLAQMNVDVLLVDEKGLGSRTWFERDACRSDLVSRLVARISDSERIETAAPARIRDIHGQIGDFTVTSEVAGEVRTDRVGAIILATGYQAIFPREQLGMAPGGAVLGLSRFWDFLSKAEGVTVAGTSRAFDIVFLLREEDEAGKLPFVAALQQAIAAKKELKSEVHLLFGNAKVAGGGLEQLYQEARRMGVVMVKYDAFPRIAETAVPVTYQADESERRPLELSFTGEQMGADRGPVDMTLAADILVSGEDLLPSDPTRHTADLLGLEKTLTGFVSADNVFMTPVLTSRRGIFAVGGCRGPMTLSEISQQADEAALAAFGILSSAVLEIVDRVAVVEPDKCALCLTCIRSCPGGAIVVDHERNAAGVAPEACQGCGICASECPADAIQLEHFTDREILSVLDVLREVGQ